MAFLIAAQLHRAAALGLQPQQPLPELSSENVAVSSCPSACPTASLNVFLVRGSAIMRQDGGKELCELGGSGFYVRTKTQAVRLAIPEIDRIELDAIGFFSMSHDQALACD